MQYGIKKKYKHKRSAKFKFRVTLFVLLIIIVLIVLYYYNVVCPIIVSLSQEKVRSVATSTISDVVGKVLSDENVTYKDIASISYSPSGEIEMIEVDAVKTNVLIREITKDVQAKFDNLGYEGINIAMGTFTGIPFLYGLGPDISLQLVPVGTINTKLNSRFVSAGINQTLHRIYFVVNARVGMVLPIKTANFNTELEVLVCENLIVGKVPEIYLQGNLI